MQFFLNTPSCQSKHSMIKIPSSGCEASMNVGKFIGRGNNVVGGNRGTVGGPMDCARLCAEESTCNAWTLNVNSNKCWLKTSSKNTGSNKNWMWGLPC